MTRKNPKHRNPRCPVWPVEAKKIQAPSSGKLRHDDGWRLEPPVAKSTQQAKVPAVTSAIPGGADRRAE